MKAPLKIISPIFLLCPLFFAFQNSSAEPAKNEQVISADSSQAKSAVNDTLKTKRKIPDREAYIEVEKEADVDGNMLAKNLIYPQEAKLKNIEGSVFVRVLVNEDGNSEIIEIIKSDNKIFNEPAISAVKNSIFTPGILNGKPIAMWIVIPIRFSLK